MVLQRGEVVIMPGAAIEAGESPIKGAVRALWEMAGILVSVNSCFEVEDTHDLAEVVIGVRLKSGGELSAEDSDWEPMWCDREELGVPGIKRIIDAVAHSADKAAAKKVEVLHVCSGGVGNGVVTEQQAGESIEGFDEWLLSVGPKNAAVAMAECGVTLNPRQLPMLATGVQRVNVMGHGVLDVTEVVNSISIQRRKTAFEMAVFKYRVSLAGEAVEQKFAELQPLVLGLVRLADTDLARIMAALGVMQWKLRHVVESGIGVAMLAEGVWADGVRNWVYDKVAKGHTAECQVAFMVAAVHRGAALLAVVKVARGLGVIDGACTRMHKWMVKMDGCEDMVFSRGLTEALAGGSQRVLKMWFDWVDECEEVVVTSGDVWPEGDTHSPPSHCTSQVVSRTTG